MIETGSSNRTERVWIESCPDCGKMGELHPCAPDNECWEPLGLCEGCPSDSMGLNWWIGQMEIDWDDWMGYWRSKR